MKLRAGAILTAIFAFVATPVFAQGVTAGVKVGVNFANISTDTDDSEIDEVDDSGQRIGFAAGGFVDVPLTEQFSFQPEILFTQKGASEEFAGVEFTNTLTQVQVPLLFKAKFAGETVRPFVVFGPAFGFTAKSELEVDGDDDIDDETVDIDDITESVEFSLVIGGGIQFGPASVELRYDHGLNDIDTRDLIDAKTRTFSVLFGFGWSN
jgi:hypothetical protein